MEDNKIDVNSKYNLNTKESSTNTLKIKKIPLVEEEEVKREKYFNEQITAINNNSQNITKTKQLLIFVPIVLLLINAPGIMAIFYLRYSYLAPVLISNSLYKIIPLVIIITFCYLLSVFVPSEQTNVNKYFDASNNILNIDNSQPGKEIKNIDSSKYKRCEFCNSYKFIRSSHCRICNKCILFRDHHCPWIANCVGFNNIRFFINFLFWAIIGISYFLCLSLRFFFKRKILKEEYKISTFIITVNTLSFPFMAIVLCGIIGIFIRTVLTVFNNSTFKEINTNFNLERYVPCYLMDNSRRDINKYNIGFLSHFYYLIGPTVFHFFLPLPRYTFYIFREDLPIFQEMKPAGNLLITKYYREKFGMFMNILDTKDNQIDYFMELAHKSYDGKNIV